MTPKTLIAARQTLKLSPTEMARAMGVSYDTYKSWQSGRRSMPAVAVRCVELLLKHPKTAEQNGLRLINARPPSRYVRYTAIQNT
jgi:DNA-binding transcriptional regulator YiaG